MNQLPIRQSDSQPQIRDANVSFPEKTKQKKGTSNPLDSLNVTSLLSLLSFKEQEQILSKQTVMAWEEFPTYNCTQTIHLFEKIVTLLPKVSVFVDYLPLLHFQCFQNTNTTSLSAKEF